MLSHLFSISTRRLPLSLTRFLSQSISHEDIYDPPFSPSKKPQKTKQQKEKKKNNSDNGASNIKEELNLPLKSDLPFDFSYSYSESNPSLKPISFRESPKFSPFGPGRLDRKWTGTSAPVQCEVDRKRFEDERNRVLGEPLDEEEVAELVERYRHSDCARQINLGRNHSPLLFVSHIASQALSSQALLFPLFLSQALSSQAHSLSLFFPAFLSSSSSSSLLFPGKGGVTHNMLDDIHNHWKKAEAVRIKCLGVPTLDMDNICFHLEDKSGGKVIYRNINILLLYRGRNYDPKNRPVIPLMLWKPYAPIYPRLVKNVVEGLTHEETKELRNKGLNSDPLMKLTRNGVYVNVVERVREAFKTDEVVRLDCTHVGTSDCKKIGVKLRDLVPCIPILFKDEQIIIWRGNLNQEQSSDP